MPSPRSNALLAGPTGEMKGRAPGVSSRGVGGLRLCEVTQPARIAGRSLAPSAAFATPASRRF